MALSEEQRRTRARRAYELGRVGAALWNAWPVIPMVLVSIFGCGRPALTLAIGALLFVAAAGLQFRGGAWGRAVRPGLVAGVVPFLLPLGAQLRHFCTASGCISFCLPACVLGGVLGGGLIGIRAARLPEGAKRFMASGALIASLAGALGCLTAGLAGLIGMALGLAASAAPFLIAARTRRA